MHAQQDNCVRKTKEKNTFTCTCTYMYMYCIFSCLGSQLTIGGICNPRSWVGLPQDSITVGGLIDPVT